MLLMLWGVWLGSGCLLGEAVLGVTGPGETAFGDAALGKTCPEETALGKATLGEGETRGGEFIGE